MIWCRGWSDLAHRYLKSRIHAAADLACVPSSATVKLICHGHHLESSLTVANDGTHTLERFEKHPHLGGQSPPSGGNLPKTALKKTTKRVRHAR